MPIYRKREKQSKEPCKTAEELFAAILASGLIGMWKDREDIGDSGKYARELRRRAQTREETS